MKPMPIKHIILCADDYGQSPKISAAIQSLAEKKHISAVSCMVNIPGWAQHIQDLKKTGVEIGLHLNFTHGKPLSSTWKKNLGPHFSGLGTLFKLILFKPSAQQAFSLEIKAQLKAFEKALGQKPDFIDGHQHIHQLPIIRQLILAASPKSAWFRTTYTQFFKSLHSVKAMALYLLGGAAFAKLIQKNQLMSNSNFSGDYRFHGQEDYRQIFIKSLRKIKDRGLIMCHPGLDSQDPSDPIRLYRFKEYQYLNSPYFINDLRLYGIELMTGATGPERASNPQHSKPKKDKS